MLILGPVDHIDAMEVAYAFHLTQDRYIMYLSLVIEKMSCAFR